MMISTNAPRLLSNWRIIGLVSLLQRCRRARASAGTSAPTTCADSDADHAGFACNLAHTARGTPSRPTSRSCAGRRCGLDGGLHRGSFAWYPGRNLTRKLHEPCVCSPLSGPTYDADVHSPRGGRPTWSDCAGRRCGLDGGLHRGSFAWYPGRNLTRKLHEPCACSPLSGPTYGADVHSPRGGRPTWSDCAGRRCGLDGGFAPWVVRMAPGP